MSRGGRPAPAPPGAGGTGDLAGQSGSASPASSGTGDGGVGGIQPSGSTNDWLGGGGGGGGGWTGGGGGASSYLFTNGTTDGANLPNETPLPEGWSVSGGGGGGGGGGGNFLSPQVRTPSFSGTQAINEGSGSVVYTACTQAATVGVPYTVDLASSESFGDPSYHWVVSDGSLPPGLGLSSTTGLTDSLVGTPTATGSYTFTIGSTGTTNEIEGFVNVTVVVGAAPPPTTTTTTTAPVNPPVVSNPRREGFRDVASDGGVFDFGADRYFGSLPGVHVSVRNIVGITATANNQGYWLVGTDGGVFAFGNARYYGSLPGSHVTVTDITDITSTPSGGGYWQVGADGGVFGFGNARYFGSLPGRGISVHDIVGIAAAPNGAGYWLVGANGQVYPFGSAGGHGSAGGLHLNAPMVGIAATNDGGGYWLVGADGGVFAFGDAAFEGSGLGSTSAAVVGLVLPQPVTATGWPRPTAPPSGSATPPTWAAWPTSDSTPRWTTKGTDRSRQPRRSPAPQVDRPALEHVVAVDQVEPLVVGHGRVDVGGQHPDAVAHPQPDCSGAKVTCSSEQNETSAPAIDGLPWSIPSALSPQSATAQSPRSTEITVASTVSAGTKGRPSVA